MIFNPTHRTRVAVAAVLAAGMVAGSTGAALASAQQPYTTTVASARVVAAPSTVPKSLMRVETAAEDVIGFLEKGQPAKSKREARIMRQIAHGTAADALRKAGVGRKTIATLQQRADRTARLSASGAPALQVSLAANSVSQMMPGLYARYHDPVPPAVLKLDYLNREIQLRAQAGQTAKVKAAVGELSRTWQQLRPQLVKAGGAKLAVTHDQHVSALQRAGASTAVQKQALRGLDIVDQMETVFLR